MPSRPQSKSRKLRKRRIALMAVESVVWAVRARMRSGWGRIGAADSRRRWRDRQRSGLCGCARIVPRRRSCPQARDSSTRRPPAGAGVGAAQRAGPADRQVDHEAQGGQELERGLPGQALQRGLADPLLDEAVAGERDGQGQRDPGQPAVVDAEHHDRDRGDADRCPLRRAQPLGQHASPRSRMVNSGLMK